MDKDAVIKKLNQTKGRAAAVAQAFLAYHKASWHNRGPLKDALCETLLEGRPKSLSAVFDNGPRQLFETLHGKKTADRVDKAVARMTDYVHSPSTYRRSFRTQSVAPYLERLLGFLETLFFSWETFDLARDLAVVRKNDDTSDNTSDDELPFSVQGDFIALAIDEGDQGAIGAVKEALLGDNNTRLLSHAVINGIVKSRDTALLKLLSDLLLAAKLQEGLRQSILENADNGRVESLVHFIQIVLDNDLVRYSSAQRAVDVWMGLDETADDKRITAKLLRLCQSCLNDDAARKKALGSKDVVEIYAALWAVSVREMNDVVPLIEKLSGGEKYQQLVGLYFSNLLENDAVQFAITSKIIGGFSGKKPPKADLDLLSLTLRCYPIDSYFPWNREHFAEECRRNEFLANDAVRQAQFDGLMAILPLVPEKGYASAGTPFSWCSLSLERGFIGTRLLRIAAYDFNPSNTTRLIEQMPALDADTRQAFVEIFLKNPATPAERGFVFASLNDKSMSVRSQALKNILGLAERADQNDGILSADEEKRVVDLLALKTGDLRQNCLKLLFALPQGRPIDAAKTLLADKNENKRLGGLDLLNQLVGADKLTRQDAAKLIEGMPSVSDREQLLIQAIVAPNKPRYSRENGFGLYDPAYRPVFPAPARRPGASLESIFGISRKRAEAIFGSLCAVIDAHRDFCYTTSYNDEEVRLGTLTWLRDRADADADSGTNFERFVLQDVWRNWIKANAVTFREIFYFMFIETVEDYDHTYEPDYLDWANRLIENRFHAKSIHQFLRWIAKQPYHRLALNLLAILWSEFPEAERFDVLYGALLDLAQTVDEADWKRPVEEEETTPYQTTPPDCLDDSNEISVIHRALDQALTDDGRFAQYVALCFELGSLSGKFYVELSAEDIARAVHIQLLEKDALMRTMFLANDGHNIGYYSDKPRYKSYREKVERYPILKLCADEAAARVLEIELDRGDSPTEVSRHAHGIHCHEGVQTFVKTLTALGNETFVRGYGWGSDVTKKAVLSSLLKASRPAPSDSADTLKAALAKSKLNDKRLIEAAMYAPSWLPIVGDYLGWPGLQSAAWYFHAHINESFSAEKETEVARYSPISPEEFNDGAFDIAWFQDAWNTLGQARFDLVYDCAKYLTEGSNHRRAQLFADACLGRLDKNTLQAEIHDKRNKDKLLAYSLIPLSSAGKKSGQGASDALSRYEFIEAFRKESKAFGAQRRESEGKASQIAIENLARNAGFADALRFAWNMEIRKIDEVKACFTPKACGEYRVCVTVDEGGAAALVCEKDGKALKSVPAALKKDPWIEECRAVVASLKAQFKRARESLERAMVNRDRFTYGEIKTLLTHPVVSPILQKLVFVTLDPQDNPRQSGMFCELAGSADDTPLRIAHPHDLFVLGTWLACQHEAFERKLVQPFKQIFRELYLINEDEKREKTASRRYAGHQVQPKQTVALLKGRGWTVDYEQGLQRVYYRENFYATIFAAADWFSPADIEAPTLEILRFFPRRATGGNAYQPLDLSTIPPVIFSEVMRDIDLAVSVAHVGGVDPEASHSTVEMRAAIVRELLALLSIGNVTVEGRHAKIRGRLGEYTVHLGSAQAHMMGRGALSILAVPSQHRGRVFLPFADEDPRTAEVMSKILLLADDKSIKDPAILAQIDA